jgi:hypothetical protein
MADRLNAARKFIATHRPESLEWGPFEGLGPDIVEGIRRIKSHDGPDLILSGSSTLTSTLSNMGFRMKSCWPSIRSCWARGSASLRREPRHAHSSSSVRSNAVRHHPQYLQGRRPFEDRIVRSRRTPSEPLSTRSARIPQQGLVRHRGRSDHRHERRQGATDADRGRRDGRDAVAGSGRERGRGESDRGVTGFTIDKKSNASLHARCCGRRHPLRPRDRVSLYRRAGDQVCEPHSSPPVFSDSFS